MIQLNYYYLSSNANGFWLRCSTNKSLSFFVMRDITAAVKKLLFVNFNAPICLDTKHTHTHKTCNKICEIE